jgi:hypothetical protein
MLSYCKKTIVSSRLTAVSACLRGMKNGLSSPIFGGKTERLVNDPVAG